jgi:hypothetical protein
MTSAGRAGAPGPAQHRPAPAPRCGSGPGRRRYRRRRAGNPEQSSTSAATQAGPSANLLTMTGTTLNGSSEPRSAGRFTGRSRACSNASGALLRPRVQRLGPGRGGAVRADRRTTDTFFRRRAPVRPGPRTEARPYSARRRPLYFGERRRCRRVPLLRSARLSAVQSPLAVWLLRPVIACHRAAAGRNYR